MKTNQIHTFTDGAKFSVRVIQQNDHALISADDLARCLGKTPVETLLQRVDSSAHHTTRLHAGKLKFIDAPTVTTFGALNLILESLSPHTMQVLVWFCQNVLPTLRILNTPHVLDGTKRAYIETVIKRAPKHWQETFSVDFCSALLDAFSTPIGSPRLKQQLEGLIRTYVYDGFIETLPADVRARCEELSDNPKKLHAFILRNLQPRFREHLGKVEALALACAGSELEFRDAYVHFCLRREQLRFGFNTPRKPLPEPDELDFHEIPACTNEGLDVGNSYTALPG